MVAMEKISFSVFFNFWENSTVRLNAYCSSMKWPTLAPTLVKFPPKVNKIAFGKPMPLVIET
jgi:hypothetical protein